MSGRALKNALQEQLLANVSRPSVSLSHILSTFLRAAELECGLADSSFFTARQIEPVTDRLAESLVGMETRLDIRDLVAIVEEAQIPETLFISPPEGIAYYALHPLFFAEVLKKFSRLPSAVVVVGIRTIGTALSAVTAAAARKSGIRARRTTVRPEGHPYNRATDLSPEQLQLIAGGIADNADFWVVDEGPGLSGSSFLSVAEALVRAGVSRQRITLICSHEPRIENLCAIDAANRWQQFHWVAASGEIGKPADASIYIGAGKWRERFFQDESCRPAVWQSFERAKYLSPLSLDPSRFFKFQGLGHYGEQAVERELRVAASRFGPEPKVECDGFVSYPLIPGRPMSDADLSPNVLARLASYCAFRTHDLSAVDTEIGRLQHMAEHNLQELRFDLPVRLHLEKPAYVDGRMQPHEWILTTAEEMLKTDAGSHCDDHFFPGVTDIAWDLAGAIVEWNMDAAETESFLAMYRRTSGDDPHSRIADFITAYTVFRSAYCTMAANAISEREEQQRMQRAAACYSALLCSQEHHEVKTADVVLPI